MRNAFWWILIGGSLVAIVAGYVQGISSARPPAVATLRSGSSGPQRLPPALRALARGGSGALAEDLFARDDVVAERTRATGENWHAEQLSIAIGLCGESIVAESGFLRLGVPMAFVLDPHGAQAAPFARLVRDANQTLFVHVDAAPGAGQLAALQRRFGRLDGIASHDPHGMAEALRGTGLMFFDERGDAANPAEFIAAAVPLVSRDVTADDFSAKSYITFMLSRAAGLSRRVGTVVVLLRPLPSSLEALRDFGNGRNVTIVAMR